MTINVTPLLDPITTDSPAGQEARSTDEYEAVAAEIEKMTSLTGSSLIDWSKVESLGTDVLAKQSKDFMMAAWVAAAWMQRAGIEGLNAGLTLFEGLINRYWETAFPTLKRMRGRRNALTWWIDRASTWLESATLAPLDPADHAALVQAVETIDRSLAELDPESPPLASFVRQIKHLDVVEEKTPTNETTPSAASDAPASGQAQPPSPAPPSPAQTAGTPRKNPGMVPETAEFSLDHAPESLDAVVQAMTPALSYLARISQALLSIDRFHPLAVEINRFAARSTLLSPPPASSGNTHLMPPPVAISDAFQTIRHAGNPEGVIEFCESRIATFPFWLDLDRESAKSYGMLGEKGAPMRQAIIKSVLAFTERMPDITELCFSDGTPFASDDTRQWIESCRADQNKATGDSDAFQSLKQQAMGDAAAGKYPSAMQIIQDYAKSTPKGRDQFRARLVLTELLLANRADANAVEFLEPLLDECRKRDLITWDPDIAEQLFQLTLRAGQQALARLTGADDADKRKRIQHLCDHALQQLGRINFVAATRYV